MAFKSATVNASDVPSTQSNFPAYVDLTRLNGGTAMTQAEADSIRVYSDSGKTTELAREIVSPSEMHVKIPSLTSDFTLYVEYDGVRADYAVTDTYGRNAVWSDYFAVYHFANDPSGTAPQEPDSTGNGYDLTASNMESGDLVTAPMGTGWAFDGVNEDATPNITPSNWLATQVSITQVLKNSASFGGTYANGGLYITDNSSPYNKLRLGSSGGLYFRTSNQTVTAVEGITTAPNNTWAHVGAVIEDNNQRNYYAGSQVNAETNAFNTTDMSGIDSAKFGSGGYNNSYAYFEENIAEFRYRKDIVSSDWMAIENNNLMDEATFWGTWTDAVGGGEPEPDRRILFTMVEPIISREYEYKSRILRS